MTTMTIPEAIEALIKAIKAADYDEAWACDAHGRRQTNPALVNSIFIEDRGKELGYLTLLGGEGVSRHTVKYNVKNSGSIDIIVRKVLKDVEVLPFEDSFHPGGATHKQVAYLLALLGKRRVSPVEMADFGFDSLPTSQVELEQLTRADASQLIELLKS